MEDLLKDYREVAKGDSVTGTVISVRGNEAKVDIGMGYDATIFADKYQPGLESFAGVLKNGDKVFAVVANIKEHEGGTNIYLSRLPLLKEANDLEVQAMASDKKVVKVKVVKNANNKGLVCTFMGNEVFIPASLVDIKRVDDLGSFVGQTIEVELTTDEEGKLKGNRRVLVQALEDEAKAAEVQNLAVGSTVEGTVSRIENYGAFVTFNRVTGLIRMSELSHVRFDKITDVVNVGDKVTVKVIGNDNGRIALSIKALQKTPYQLFAESHKVSDTIEGKIVQKLPYGAIVEVASNVSALLHVSEITWNPNDNKLASLKINEVVNCAIISMDDAKERIGLSMKVLEDNPWAKVTGNVGDTVTCKITEIVAGRYVKVSCFGVDGIINLRDITMNEKSAKIEDYYSVGDEITAVVTVLDTRYWKLELSNKKYTQEVERQQFEEYSQKQQAEEPTTTLGDLFKDLLK